MWRFLFWYLLNYYSFVIGLQEQQVEYNYSLIPKFNFTGNQLSGFPIFVKFHKTGSGTGSTIFRKHCSSSMKLPEINGPIPWGGRINETDCNHAPHTHDTLKVFRNAGIVGFQKCLGYKIKPQLFTVIRNPIEKLFSGIYFWDKYVFIYTNFFCHIYIKYFYI
mmetsp:Transcript_30548/g.39370  ORF Transcript_30548/g.39370 Transcript_30548/m.39370 type:complete len:163 (+) Transcript_30548:172-660(+)